MIQRVSSADISKVLEDILYYKKILHFAMKKYLFELIDAFSQKVERSIDKCDDEEFAQLTRSLVIYFFSLERERRFDLFIRSDSIFGIRIFF